MSQKIQKIIQSLINLFGYKIISVNNFENKEKDIDMDKEFMRIYDKCHKYTMTSKVKMFALYKAIEYIEDKKILGDFVECGVWKGGSAMVIAHTLLRLKKIGRKIYLYDTYAGMAKPTDKDCRLGKNEMALDKWNDGKTEDGNEWCFASLLEVKRNLFSTGYPQENIIFVEGMVEDTIPQILPEKISLLRLDTDWYESTKHELINLYPLLSENGVLILDDYGYWAGSKKAIDEYFMNKDHVEYFNRLDSAGRLIIKSVINNKKMPNII